MEQWTGLHLITHVFTYVFVTLSILQSQFTEKGFKRAENYKQNVVLLLFLFTLTNLLSSQKYFVITNTLFSRQTFCRSKHFCRNKSWVLSQQNFCYKKNDPCGSSLQWCDGGCLPCSRRLRTDDRLAGNWYFRMHFRWLRYSCQSVNQSINWPLSKVN